MQCEKFANADEEAAEQGDDATDEETEFDWQIEQEPFSATALPLDGPKYGFANQRCAVLQRIQVSAGVLTAYLYSLHTRCTLSVSWHVLTYPQHSQERFIT